MMKFALINGRVPFNSFCAFCCEALTTGYVRELATRICYCSHVCYDAHCNTAVLAIEYHARSVS